LPQFDEGAANVAFLWPGFFDPMGRVLLHLAGESNRDLGPETSDNWSVGLDISPVRLPRLNAGITYFNIDYQDRILFPPFSFVGVLEDPRAATLVTLGPPDPGILARIENYQQLNLTGDPDLDFPDADAVYNGLVTNLARNKTTGVDVSASYRAYDGPQSDLTLSVNGTYMFDFEFQVSPGDSRFDTVDKINFPKNLRMNTGVRWSYRGFTTNLIVNHISAYDDDRQDPVVQVASWTTANLTLGYDTRGRTDGWLAGTRFLVSAVNLFDEDPPFVASLRLTQPSNFDPSAHDPIGRLLSVQITKQW
jgi:hypothetical protein